jgi:hypothetical protein
MANARKPALGNIPLGQYYESVSILKQQMDMMTGRNGGELPTLSPNATTGQIITAINAIINRLNASTN